MGWKMGLWTLQYIEYYRESYQYRKTSHINCKILTHHKSNKHITNHVRFSLDLRLGPEPSKSGVPFRSEQLESSRSLNFLVARTSNRHFLTILLVKQILNLLRAQWPYVTMNYQKPSETAVLGGVPTNCCLSRCWALCLLIDSRIRHPWIFRFKRPH